MSLVELTEYLIKNLVSDPDSVSVRDYEDDDFVTIEVLVSNDDMGAVIGTSGRVINAIRTIVQASSYANDKKKVKINVDSL